MENELKNIRIKLAYDGSKFDGWQKNYENDNSVESHLKKAIKQILNEEIVLYAASRTDKGVHSLCQVVNFRTVKEINLFNFKKSLRNSLDYIYILDIDYAPIFFHSRQNAIGKKYIYQIWNSQEIEITYYPYCWHIKKRLDYELMQKYSKLFCGKRDFKNLSRTDKENTIRTIFDIKVKNLYPLFLIEITGESFLYNMIRCIVGNLILLSTGEITLSDAYKRHLIAPAQGLFLKEVYY